MARSLDRCETFESRFLQTVRTIDVTTLNSADRVTIVYVATTVPGTD